MSLVEALGYLQISGADRDALQRFFSRVPLLPITRQVVDGAVALRQQRKMSLGDALIAATALAYGLPLATHNTRDFDWIDALTVLDPLTA